MKQQSHYFRILDIGFASSYLIIPTLEEYRGNNFALYLLHTRLKPPKQAHNLRLRAVFVLASSVDTYPSSEHKNLAIKIQNSYEPVEYYMNVRLRCDDEQLIIFQRID